MGNKLKGTKRASSNDDKFETKKSKPNTTKQLPPSPPSEDEESEEEEVISSDDELDISDSEDDLDQSDNNEDEEVEEIDQDQEEPVSDSTPDPNKKSSKEQHLEQKKLLTERKLQRKSGVQIQRIKSLWEKLRSSNTSKSQKDTLCNEIWELSKDCINDLVLKHDASRVVQTLVKYSNKHRRLIIVESLKGSFYQLATSAYGKYLLIKLLHYGSKESRQLIINELHGKLRKLMRHREGAYVVEDLFVLYATNEQKQQMIREFWGSQFAFFKDLGAEKTVIDIVNENSEKKQLIMTNLFNTIKASVEKGSTGFQILHAAMKEYTNILIQDLDLNDSSIREFIDLLQEQFAELVHTQEGSEVANKLISIANAKERKGIIKSLKSHTNELIKNEFGNLVLITLFMTVDDTVLVFKSFNEIFTPEILPSVIQDKFSRRPLLYLFKGLDGKYFNPNVKKQLQSYQELAYKKTSKKDKSSRKKELLDKSITPIYKSLIELDQEALIKVLSNNMSLQLITELLLTQTDSKEVNQELRPKLINIIIEHCIKGDVLEDYHLLNKTPFISRSLKSLIQGNQYKFNNDTKKLEKIDNEEPQIPGLGAEFAERIIDEIEQIDSWTSNQGAFILVSIIEVLQLTGSKKLKQLTKDLKQQKKQLIKSEDKGSKLLGSLI